MLMNYVSLLKHSRDYADSEYVTLCEVDRKGAVVIGNKQTDTQLHY